MANYIPQLPFTTALLLLIPTYKKVKGTVVKKYPSLNEAIRFNGTFKTYGGTESTVNGVYTVIDTANIETWYRPDIKSDCRIALTDGAVYAILGEPENINMRNQFLKFKVRRVKGGA